MTDTTADASSTFDPYGLPDGHGSNRAWEDLARGVEAARAKLGWGQPAALYGVLSPTMTTARHDGDVSALRDLLDEHVEDPHEHDSGVVMEVVLAGSSFDPWKLVVGQAVPPGISALVLVWEPAERERTVVTVTRAGRTVIVRRMEDDDAAGTCACPLTNALRHLLKVPVDAPSLTVSQWLGRLTAAAVTNELVAVPSPDVERVVLSAAAHLATLTGAAPSSTWSHVPDTPARDLLPADVDLAWFGPSALAWFAAAHSEPQDSSWHRLAMSDPAAAVVAHDVLEGLGWGEPLTAAATHG